MALRRRKNCGAKHPHLAAEFRPNERLVRRAGAHAFASAQCFANQRRRGDSRRDHGPRITGGIHKNSVWQDDPRPSKQHCKRKPYQSVSPHNNLSTLLAACHSSITTLLRTATNRPAVAHTSASLNTSHSCFMTHNTPTRLHTNQRANTPVYPKGRFSCDYGIMPVANGSRPVFMCCARFFNG